MVTGVIHLLILIDVSHRGLAACAFFSEGLLSSLLPFYYPPCPSSSLALQLKPLLKSLLKP